MTDVERLCHVRRGVIEHDGFAFSKIMRAEIASFFGDFPKNGSGEIGVVDAEIQISAAARHLRYPFRRGKGETLVKRRRDSGRPHSQCAAEPEAGESEISHCSVGRNLQYGRDLVGGKCAGTVPNFRDAAGYGIGNVLFQLVHSR